MTMAPSYRKERLNERIRELIGELVQNRIKDPRIGLVTITAVAVASDYASARVYFTVMGDEQVRAETRKGLESAKSYMRKAVGRELKLRQTPELRFLYDDTLDRAMRIDEMIGENRRSENSSGGDEGDLESGEEVDDDDDEDDDEEDQDEEDEDDDDEEGDKEGRE